VVVVVVAVHLWVKLLLLVLRRALEQEQVLLSEAT
jgi:hypothetical protein